MGKCIVLRLKGKQYRASEGEEFKVDYLGGKDPKAEVLLFSDQGTVKIGKPVLSDIKVSLKVLGDELGEKLHVLKYKAKSRYRRHIGFRPKYTKVLLEKLS